MSRFALWSNGEWVVFGLYVLLVVGGIVIVVTAKGWARRKAIREGRVDAGGDPVYDEHNSPAQSIRAGIGLCVVGLGLIAYALLKARS
jgi:hypothetical protein